MHPNPRTLTEGQLARLLDAKVTTAAKWRAPRASSNFRRMPVEAMLALVVEHGYDALDVLKWQAER